MLIGAFLSFGVDFGHEPTVEAAIVLMLKLTLIIWAWQQTALFFNRFGACGVRRTHGRESL